MLYEGQITVVGSMDDPQRHFYAGMGRRIQDRLLEKALTSGKAHLRNGRPAELQANGEIGLRPGPNLIERHAARQFD